MNAQHTPGPWVVQRYGDSDPIWVMGADVTLFVAKMGSAMGYCAPPYNEQYANARLIAAAPELLQACKAVLKIIEAESEACGIYKAHTELIRAAIAKAER